MKTKNKKGILRFILLAGCMLAFCTGWVMALAMMSDDAGPLVSPPATNRPPHGILPDSTGVITMLTKRGGPSTTTPPLAQLIPVGTPYMTDTAGVKTVNASPVEIGSAATAINQQ